MECRRRDLGILATCAVAFFLYFNLRNLHRTISTTSPLHQFLVPEEQHEVPINLDIGPANSTLGVRLFRMGRSNTKASCQVLESCLNLELRLTFCMQFAGIIAVSKKNSHRRSSLIRAANLTGIDIIIPDQPVWTDADVESVKTKQLSVISRGSAMAWLGHLNALKWYVISCNVCYNCGTPGPNFRH
jgi:hypothetical protein